MTLSIPVWADAHERSVVSAVMESIAVAGAMALAARVQFSLMPFSPAPLTLQTFVVLLAGYMVGPRRASAGLMAFAVLGAFGAPILAAPLGVTLGYLAAFLAVPWVATRFRNTVVGVAAGTLLIYVLGAAWMALYTHSLQTAIVAGVLPFLPGDALKAAAAAKLAERYRRD